MDIDALLAFSIRNQASDLHLSAGQPPLLRIHGDLRRVNLAPLTPEALHDMLHALMDEAQQQRLAQRRECDFSFRHDRLGRFRINIFYQQRGLAAAIRPIAHAVPTLEQLGAPAACAELAQRAHGLVLVTGPTGSGKSSTLAAMLHHINRERGAHLLTIEDPVEFIHPPLRALVTQRELGRDALSFADALRAALREDPDVIMVGELRDAETIRLALRAAETGHLVLATLHTASAVKAPDRIVDAFDAGQQDSARAMLADCLQGVISQVLLPACNGRTRVAAHEVMLCNAAIRNLIREGKSAQIASTMQAAGSRDSHGNSNGMLTLEQSLGALLHAGHISLETARSHARSLDFFPV